MSLQVADTLVDGIKRTLSKNGLMLVAALYVLLAIQILFLPSEAGGAGLGGTAVGLLVSLVVSVASLYVVVVSLRTFATDETETIPDSALSDRPAWALLNVFIGAIVFGILVAIGLVLLIVPGIFLLVSLWMFYPYVAVENDNFVTAMQRSWSLASGNRVGLFVVGFVVIVISAAISVPFSFVSGIIDGAPGQLLGQVGGAFSTIFMYATTATAFNRLRDSEASGDEQAQSDEWGASTDEPQGSPGV